MANKMSRKMSMAALGAGAATAMSLLTCLSTIPASAQGIHYGGTLTLVNAPPPAPYTDIMNPWAPANPIIQDIMIYEPLYYYNQFTGQSTPKLAVSYTYSDNHKVITVDLRQGVHWSNGTSFSSADVAYTLNMISTHPAIDFNGLGSMIQSVKADGPDKVIITLKAVNSSAWYYIGTQTPIVPAHIWSKVKDPATYQDADPVTTGPFLFKSINASMATFVRNPHYWDHGKPYVNELDFPYYGDNNSGALAEEQGKFDAGVAFIPNIQTSFLNRSRNYYRWDAPIDELVLYPNDAVYPLSLTAFRQALSDAINRNQVSLLGEFGYLPPGNSAALPNDPNSQQFIDKSVLKRYPLTYNLALAKKLLSQAGFTWDSSGQLLDPHKKPVSVTITVDAGYNDWIADAGVVAQNWKALGIDAQVKTPSVATTTNELANGSYQVGMYVINWGATPFIGYNAVLNSAFSAPIGKTASTNQERWVDKQTDTLLNQYTTTFDLSQQKAIMSKLETIFAKQLPLIPLVEGHGWGQINTTNLVGWPSPSNPWAAFVGNFDDQYMFEQVHLR